VLVVFSGDHGKPRPAMVVQADILTEPGLHGVVVCPTSSHRSGQRRYRVAVEPSASNGLHQSSGIMTEKIVGVARRVREVVGWLEPATLRAVESARLLGLGFADVR
jgi:mRNA interferase MazF